MIDVELKQRMEAAYLSGDKKLALDLSQQLDEQVVKEQRNKYSQEVGRINNLTILDLKPKIAEYAVELYFSGMAAADAIAKAIEKFKEVNHEQ
jgi:hypothetical protein